MSKLANLLVASALLVSALSTSAHGWMGTNIGPNTVGSVAVVVSDRANGECWTNSWEVKSKAEDKLRLQGYIVEDRKKAKFIFEVVVNARREGNNQCVGLYDISLMRNATVEDIFAVFIVAQERGYFYQSDSVNRNLLVAVRQLIDSLG